MSKFKRGNLELSVAMCEAIQLLMMTFDEWVTRSHNLCFVYQHDGHFSTAVQHDVEWGWSAASWYRHQMSEAEGTALQQRGGRPRERSVGTNKINKWINKNSYPCAALIEKIHSCAWAFVSAQCFVCTLRNSILTVFSSCVTFLSRPVAKANAAFRPG